MKKVNLIIQFHLLYLSTHQADFHDSEAKSTFWIWLVGFLGKLDTLEKSICSLHLKSIWMTLFNPFYFSNVTCWISEWNEEKGNMGLYIIHWEL